MSPRERDPIAEGVAFEGTTGRPPRTWRRTIEPAGVVYLRGALRVTVTLRPSPRGVPCAVVEVTRTDARWPEVDELASVRRDFFAAGDRVAMARGRRGPMVLLYVRLDAEVRRAA